MTDDDTSKDLDAIRKRWAKATPGPWESHPARPTYLNLWDVFALDGEDSFCLVPDVSREDAEAIAHAPDDIAALLAEVEHLKLFGEEAHAAGLQWTKRALAAESERDAMRAVVDAYRKIMAMAEIMENEPAGRFIARQLREFDGGALAALDAATGEVDDDGE